MNYFSKTKIQVVEDMITQIFKYQEVENVITFDENNQNYIENIEIDEKTEDTQFINTETVNVENGESIKQLNYFNKKELVFTGVKRNEKCPCNSGLRYKECHGKLI